MKYHFIIRKIIPAFVLLLAACQAKTPEGTGTDNSGRGGSVAGSDRITLSNEQVSTAGIRSGKLVEKALSVTLSCNGSVEVPPQSLVSVSLPMEGYVKKINFYSGTKVRRGDLLAVLEHPRYLDIQKDYMILGNNLAVLKQDLERQEILAKEDAASQKKLMQARAEFQNALVQHSALAEQLKLLGIDPGKITPENLSSEVKVFAPINGYVKENYANTGELMTAGQSIMDLEDVSHLHVHLVVYEKDINRVREGQEVEFTTEAGQGLYKATIVTVGKSIHDESRSADVHVHIRNPDAALMSGMYVKARILMESKTVYALPEEGISDENGQSYVFVREGNDFLRLPVRTGTSQDGFVEIISPDNLLGKEIVLAGAYYLNASIGEEE